ncbi:MAG: hypothetical protein K2X86_09110 [Cytophagaceae bacterium]|nr:hypothetical protein [Cytophagaceae bacterium]
MEKLLGNHKKVINFANQIIVISLSYIVMKIYQNNGTVLKVPLADIDSITYEQAGMATLGTENINNITSGSAQGGGNIFLDGGTPITQRGVCWSTSPNPTIADSKTVDGNGTGAYSSLLTGLIAGTTYYVRAYATNNVGTAYGNEVSFTSTVMPATILISDFDGNGSWKTFLPLGLSPNADSDSADNTNDPVPRAYAGSKYWKTSGTSSNWYLEGMEVNVSFTFDSNDSIVFYAHNLNSPNTKVFVQLDKKQINGSGEVFSFEILLPASNSWVHYAVGVDQLAAWQYHPNYNDPAATHVYYPSLAAVDKMWFLVNSVAMSETIEVNFDNIQIIRVP